MKKSIALLIVCFTIIFCVTINLQWKDVEQGKLGITMSNIEALASGENQEVSCKLPGSLDCPKSTIKVLYIL